MEEFTVDLFNESSEESLDETIYNIDKLISEIEIYRNKQKLEEQQHFNSKFLLKFVLFVFLYRTFTMYVDPDCILVNGIEKIFNNLTYEEYTKTNTKSSDCSD
jgi:hypothetical protein